MLVAGRSPGITYTENSIYSPQIRLINPLQSAKQHPVIVARCAIRYTLPMIKSFLHKGLRRYYKTGSKSGIQAQHEKRLRLQLTALDTATSIDDMDIPGFKLHSLKGKEKGRWSIWVNGNWRITFEFRDGHAYVLNYEDYH